MFASVIKLVWCAFEYMQHFSFDSQVLPLIKIYALSSLRSKHEEYKKGALFLTDANIPDSFG